MVGFNFGGNTGETPETLRRKRSLAEALAVKTSAAPKNVGEGLNAIGNALIYRALMGKVDAGEAAGQKTLEADRAAFMGGFGGAPAAAGGSSSIVPMTDAAGEVSATSPASGGNYRDAIASIESAGSGDYAAVGPTHPKMGRALGRYQIMESNIGPWSQAALGRAVTPDEFMADPKIQDAIFDHQFGQYVQKYGPEGAAQAWLGGPGGVGKTGRRDSLGTSIGAYGQRFMKAVGGGTEVASLDPSAGMSAADAIEAVAPQSGGYRDPMVSAPNSRGAVANALMAPAPQTSQPSSVVAALSSPQANPRNASDALPVGEMASTTNAAAPPYQGVTVAQALGSGPSVQQAFKLLNNPYATDADKAMATAVIEQAQKRNDPSYQLEQDYRRAQLDALRAKPAKTWQKLDDTTLFNPETGETQRVNAPAAGNGQFRFEGKSVEAQALNGLMDAGTLTPAQAQQLGAGKTITGPNGEIIFMTPQGVFGQAADGTLSPMSAPQPPQAPAAPQAPANGVDIFGTDAPAAPTPPTPPTPPAPPVPPQVPQQPAAPQRQGMIPLTEPRVTVDESKAGGFADRMLEANALLDTYGNAGLSPWSQAVTDNSYIPDVMENYLVNENFQKYSQARRNFINAQLRRESGAVISPEEFENANKQYFPMPGDTQEVLKQKAQGRKTAVDAMIRDAGPTFKQKSAGDGVPSAGQVVDGYRFKGGDPAQQSNWEKVQ